MDDDPRRHLLIGLIAHRVGLIDETQLVEALRDSALGGGPTLADHLAARGALDAEGRSAVESVAALHLKRHGGDAERSLATIAVEPAVLALVTTLGDLGLTETVAQIGSGSGSIGPKASAPVAEADDGRRFRDRRPHARGGLGAVFVAIDAELHREVALKQILEDRADDPVSRRRFVLEAEITGGLEHPGIVPVYGLGTDADGRPYYAMRFIRGDSLKETVEQFHRDRCRERDPGRRSLGLRKLLRRFLDVCNAIDYAHGRGVLHRDIKPANIILGRHGETLVVDWGLASAKGKAEPGGPSDERPLTPTSALGSTETMPGSAMGTPAYMSPEQARGDLEALGPRSDVYSLGTTLYTLLTGRLPFEGNLSEVLRRVRAGAFDPPRRVDPGLDAALEAVCLKAMALEPSGRYPTARALADDVERWMADEPVSAWREPLARRARRWGRRHRTAIAVSAVATAAAAAVLGAVAIVQTEARNRLDRANSALSRANAATTLARDEAERRVGLAMEALGSFAATVDENLDVKNLPENAPLREALLRGPLDFYQRLRDDLADADDTRPEVRVRLADAYGRIANLTGDLGSQADAMTAFDEAVAILSDLPGGGGARARADLSRLLAERAIVRSQNGRMDDAEADYRRALRLREELALEEPAAAEYPLGQARVLQNLADMQSASGAIEAALASLDRSIESAGEALRLEPGLEEAEMVRARAFHRTGSLLLERQGRFVESQAAIESAVAALEPLAAARPDDLDTRLALADAYATLALAQERQGRHVEGLRLYQKRLAETEALAAVRPSSSLVRRNVVAASREVAATLGDLGRHAEALEILDKGLGTAEALVAANPTNASALSTLSNVHNAIAVQRFGLGGIAEALSAIEAGSAALARQVEIDPHDLNARRNLAGSQYNIGYLRRELGDVEAAVLAYNESLAMRLELDREYPDDPRFAFDAASTLGNLAAIDLKEGEPLRARDAFSRAVDLLDRLVREHPEDVDFRNYLARAQTNLASTLTELGELDRADRLLDEAGPALERLIADEPEVVIYRQDLGLNLHIRGEVALGRGRTDEAIDWNRRALESYERALASRPEDTSVINDDATVQSDLADILNAGGRPGETLDALDRAESKLTAALDREPDAGPLKTTLAGVLRRRSEALARLGRPEDAADAWSRSEAWELVDGLGGLGPVLIAAWSGDPSRALAELDAIDASLPAPSPERLVAMASAASSAAMAALVAPADPDLADRCAVRAVSLLSRAASLGHFDHPSRHASLSLSPTWTPLRDRDDFKLLLLDLAFPSDPFAKGP